MANHPFTPVCYSLPTVRTLAPYIVTMHYMPFKISTLTRGNSSADFPLHQSSVHNIYEPFTHVLINYILFGNWGLLTSQKNSQSLGGCNGQNQTYVTCSCIYIPNCGSVRISQFCIYKFHAKPANKPIFHNLECKTFYVRLVESYS